MIQIFEQGILWDGTFVLCARSQSVPKVYEVHFNPETGFHSCSCPAAMFRPETPCKHVAQAVFAVNVLLSHESRLESLARESDSMKQISPTVGNIGPVRLSYLNVFKPRMNALRGEEQYGAVLLIPKEAHEHLPDPKAEISGVAAMIKAAATDKFGPEIKKYDIPFKDGDKEIKDDGEPKHPGYWFLKVSSGTDYPPKLIDGKKAEVKGGWESGDWGICQVAFKAYDYQGKKGVGAYLRAVQFLYQDEHFGGGGGASTDDFDEVKGAAAPTASAGDEYDPFADE